MAEPTKIQPKSELIQVLQARKAYWERLDKQEFAMANNLRLRENGLPGAKAYKAATQRVDYLREKPGKPQERKRAFSSILPSMFIRSITKKKEEFESNGEDMIGNMASAIRKKILLKAQIMGGKYVNHEKKQALKKRKEVVARSLKRLSELSVKSPVNDISKGIDGKVKMSKTEGHFYVSPGKNRKLPPIPEYLNADKFNTT